jgi:Flp pilus assembly protein CpaB
VPVLDPLRERSRSLLKPVRRAVLGRRRLLAALCAGVAVLAGLRATSAPPPARVDVPVLARDVAAGSVLTEADLASVAYDPDSVPPGVVDAAAGRMVATAVLRGEPVTATRLVGPRLARGSGGVTAMPVRFPDSAMAALLRVGDLIDVLAVDPQGGAPGVVARGVRVLVLPVPPTGGTGSDGLPGRLAVLGVPVADVTRVADASVRLFLTFAYDH